MTNLKTPLRYPGGKSRAVGKIKNFFPNLSNCKEYREPFLGGGSVALHISIAFPHLNIWVNDLYEPLTNFWQILQKQGDEIASKLKDIKTNTSDCRVLFEDSKSILQDRGSTPVERAIAFYIVNKCSFSGLTESSSFSRQASIQNFSMRGINKLPQYSRIIQRWTITNDNYEILLTDLVNAFVYLDPPYEIDSNLYGKKGDMHEGFDHDKFAYKCDQRTAKMLISYNSSQLIKDRFNSWSASEYAHTYTMRSVGDYMSKQKQRKELLLFNYNKEPKIQFSFESCYNYDKLNSSGLT
tara:strand:- start:2533 stop:3420 length:888 start_codon:yes stop_codon:yes gene_type:complete